jgi:hypothetical protein
VCGKHRTWEGAEEEGGQGLLWICDLNSPLPEILVRKARHTGVPLRCLVVEEGEMLGILFIAPSTESSTFAGMTPCNGRKRIVCSVNRSPASLMTLSDRETRVVKAQRNIKDRRRESVQRAQDVAVGSGFSRER